MSSFTTRFEGGEEENRNQPLEQNSSISNPTSENQPTLPNQSSEIFRHYNRFRHLKRMLSWIIGMILFTASAVVVYENWF